MRKLFVLLFFCNVAFAVRHSLKYLLIGTSGLPDFPEFMATATVDEVQVGYCDSNKKAEPKQEWAKELVKNDSGHLDWYSERCLLHQQAFRLSMDNLKQGSDTEAPHVLQRLTGCEWDDETGETKGFDQFGYDGEDFMALDLKTFLWIALKSEAVNTKVNWNAIKGQIQDNKNYYINNCPDLLKRYVHHWRSFLQRTEKPSVSLLQRTPSSPISCFATHFYPDRAEMFWRKDGEEIHEGVEKGEILPNNDETFQMSVELNISSIKLEDWKRYDCVFQLSGIKDDLIIKLNKALIRTNRVSPSEFPVGPVVGAVVGIVVLVFVAGVFFWIKYSNGAWFLYQRVGTILTVSSTTLPDGDV
ncbi:major histocompatibility complex class I-related gene protein [Kryptolebias marmoratus]|uniref:major histocompatibility complex class I-related gene protein n=1 Tax=Kryptolebias marmoratus TaxID=37003 RepID=UPI0007F8ACEF|nr:major histocompatibility complex class I-related gene protein [Kryptolebias marmoratus]